MNKTEIKCESRQNIEKRIIANYCITKVTFTNFIDENSADQGRLFRTTKRLLARTNELSFPDNHGKKALVNGINDFFVRKIT